MVKSTKTKSKQQVSVSKRVKLRRKPKRGHYDLETICQIIDSAMFCSLSCIVEDYPYIIPTMHWRDGEHLYFHGSAASKILNEIKDKNICVNISHFDGLVLARSGFNHSVNYHSVTILGKGFLLEDKDEKEKQLKNFMDLWFPGRWEELRTMTDAELRMTKIGAVSIREASAKIRSGTCMDNEEDYAHPVWAGVIPLEQSASLPQKCPRLSNETKVPPYIENFIKKIGKK